MQYSSGLQPIVIPSAPVVQNPLLYVRPFSVVIYIVGLCPTVECCLCVGKRQALLQGWLLCVGFVCLANVPDLVRWRYLSFTIYFSFLFYCELSQLEVNKAVIKLLDLSHRLLILLYQNQLCLYFGTLLKNLVFVVC